MDSLQILMTWISTVTPVLPSAGVLRWVQPLFWGVVMAFLVAQVFSRRSVLVRRTAMVAAFAWAFLPGSLSPTWWLGLAFQLPSWTTVLLCGAFVFAQWPRSIRAEPKREGLGFLGWMAIVSGLFLLLDMFILLPFALYRWGFSALAFSILLAIATAVWVASQNPVQRREAAVALVAMALFVLTRLPTGNVFDALLDPWLWLVLAFRAARQAATALKSRL